MLIWIIGKFTQLSANWPGSTHDSHIFTTSSLCTHLEGTHRGLQDGMILGDSGYACRPFLMTPFINPTERYQQRFNRSHSTTRSIIERAFGILKKRFHVLHSEVCHDEVFKHFQTSSSYWSYLSRRWTHIFGKNIS